MVPPTNQGVEIKAGKRQRPRRLHVGFLAQFPPRGLLRRLAQIHPAAGEMPAGDIGVADQKKAPGLVGGQDPDT